MEGAVQAARRLQAVEARTAGRGGRGQMAFRGRGSQAQPVDGWGVLLFLGGDGTAPGAPDRAAARAAPCAEGMGTGDWSTWLIYRALARMWKGQSGVIDRNRLCVPSGTCGARHRRWGSAAGHPPGSGPRT